MMASGADCRVWLERVYARVFRGPAPELSEQTDSERISALTRAICTGIPLTAAFGAPGAADSFRCRGVHRLR